MILINIVRNIQFVSKLKFLLRNNKVYYNLLKILQNFSNMLLWILLVLCLLLHVDLTVYTLLLIDSVACYFIPAKMTWTAIDVANAFFNEWICRFGVPSKIISDRDRRFNSKFWQ